MRSLFAILLAFNACNCDPAITPGPKPVPSGDVETQACASMAEAGCQEGLNPNCAAVIRHVEQTNLTFIDVGCLSTANTPEKVYRCGQACTQK